MWPNVFKVHPCCGIYQHSFVFISRIIFCWIDNRKFNVHFVYPFTIDGKPKINGSWWRVLTKHGPLGKAMANHFSILALRTPWIVWKGKRYDTERWTSQVGRCPGYYWRSGEIIPQRMKRQGQSKNSVQLWMWLVIKVKSDSLKNNVT